MGPRALTAKPATACPEIAYITVILSWVSARNCSLIRLNLWLFFRWFPHGSSAVCKKNSQIRLLKKVWCILPVLCTWLNSFSIQLEAHQDN